MSKTKRERQIREQRRREKARLKKLNRTSRPGRDPVLDKPEQVDEVKVGLNPYGNMMLRALRQAQSKQREVKPQQRDLRERDK